MSDREAPSINTLEDQHGGGAPRRREQRAAARRVSSIAHAAVLAALFWWFCNWIGLPAGLGPLLVVLALLPWGALLMIARWRGIVHADSTGAYRGVAKLLHGPSLLLAVTAMVDVHLLAWWPVLPLTILGGGTLAVIAVRLDRRPKRKKRSAVVLIVLTALAYGYGVVAEADTWLDGAPPQQFTVRVLAKHVAGGSRAPIRHYLTVEPWGPRAEADDVFVDGKNFRAVSRGDTVCISLYPGALGIPWYSAAACG